MGFENALRCGFVGRFRPILAGCQSAKHPLGEPVVVDAFLLVPIAECTPLRGVQPALAKVDIDGQVEMREVSRGMGKAQNFGHTWIIQP